MTGTRYLIDPIDIEILKGASAQLSLREIGLSLSVPKPKGTVNRRLERLERAGFITRQPRQNQYRLTRLLTAAGRSALENPEMYLFSLRQTGVPGDCRTCGKTKTIAAKGQCYGCYQAERRRNAATATPEKD